MLLQTETVTPKVRMGRKSSFVQTSNALNEEDSLLVYGYEDSETPVFTDTADVATVSSPVHTGLKALSAQFITVNSYRSMHVDASGLGADAIVTDQTYPYSGWIRFSGAPASLAQMVWFTRELSPVTVATVRLNTDRSIRFFNGAGTLLITGPVLAVDTWHKWQVNLQQNSTVEANGIWEFIVNEAVVGSGTSSFRTTAISRVRPGCIVANIPGMTHDDLEIGVPV